MLGRADGTSSAILSINFFPQLSIFRTSHMLRSINEARGIHKYEGKQKFKVVAEIIDGGLHTRRVRQGPNGAALLG